VSPILVRPVREQLEHDRIIRLLQTRNRRRFEVAINPGNEQNAVVGTGALAMYPDLVLLSTERGRRLQGIIEVETGESVNHLEAMAQWARLARLRAPFHLYVPTGSVDSAKRFCLDNQIAVAEIWTYHTIGDQVRFALVHRAPVDARAAARAARRRAAAPSRTRKAGARAAKPAGARSKKAAKTARPTRRK
jgi:hypothetical protein